MALPGCLNGLMSDGFGAMKNIIIYFTGTGNSLAVARLLAANLQHTSIISVNEMLQRSSVTLETDTCGFVFPVYCQDAPEIVRRLVRAIRLPASAYIYGVATHNGDPGFSHFSLDRILRKKGQHLKAGFAVLMPGNSITPHDFTNSEEEMRRRLQAAASSAEKISADVLRKASLPYAGSASLRKRLRGFRNMLRHKFLFNVPQKFWVTDACNRCGFCVQICPEKNISLNSDSLNWGKQCQMCLGCIHWCPQQAVQNGSGTVGRKRYHHPDISINDMIRLECTDTASSAKLSISIKGQ
jgi:ferredoxin